MPAAPRVSVCIPAYNAERFVGEAVRSVLSQSFTDFELIVRDDASTDATRERLAAFADPRLRVSVNARNLGAEGNWNAVVSEARGEFVKVLCSDDCLRPDCLRLQVETLDDPRNADALLACCRREIIDADGRVLMVRRWDRFQGLLPGREAVRRIVRSGTNPVGEPAAVLFRRRALERTGGFDGSLPYVIDLDLWCRMLLHGSVIATPDASCAFRVAVGSWSLRLALQQARNYRLFVKRLARDPRFGLSRGDRMVGWIKSAGLNLARIAFYATALPWRQSGSSSSTM